METTPSTRQLLECQRTIARNVAYLTFVQRNASKLDALPRASFYSDYCDFDNLTRPERTAVMLAFPGTWTKSPGYDGGLTYTLEGTIDGLTVRCYNSEPPASCRVVETVEYRVVPERMERIVHRTVECEPLDPDLTAHSTFNNPNA